MNVKRNLPQEQNRSKKRGVLKDVSNIIAPPITRSVLTHYVLRFFIFIHDFYFRQGVSQLQKLLLQKKKKLNKYLLIKAKILSRNAHCLIAKSSNKQLKMFMNYITHQR